MASLTRWTWVWVMDKEAWSVTIHGVAKSRTRLSDWTELNWTELTQQQQETNTLGSSRMSSRVNLGTREPLREGTRSIFLLKGLDPGIWKTGHLVLWKRNPEALVWGIKHLTCGRTEVRIYIQFLKNHRSRKTWSGVKYLKCWEKEPTNLEFCALWNLSFKSEREIKTFSDKWKWRVFVVRSASQEKAKRRFFSKKENNTDQRLRLT